jgi:cytochrome bd-type quinol oxidase subunit 2
LCLGYALLGTCWLVNKGEGELREAAYFPLMLLYTVISYGVFRGKVWPTADHY